MRVPDPGCLSPGRDRDERDSTTKRVQVDLLFIAGRFGIPGMEFVMELHISVRIEHGGNRTSRWYKLRLTVPSDGVLVRRCDAVTTNAIRSHHAGTN